MYCQQWSLTQWLGNCLFNVLWCLHCYSVTVSCVWTICVKFGPVLVYYGLAFYCFLVHEESLTIDMQSSPYCSNSKQPGSGRMLLPHRKLLFFISQYCHDICCCSLVVIIQSSRNDLSWYCCSLGCLWRDGVVLSWSLWWWCHWNSVEA